MTEETKQEIIKFAEWYNTAKNTGAISFDGPETVVNNYIKSLEESRIDILEREIKERATELANLKKNNQ